MMRVLILLFMFSLTFGLQAQREAANWYFGQNAGLNFNDDGVTPLFDGQINTIEGCSTFSDPDGNLLFYTEGRTVWNKNHNVMPNGIELKGSFSSAQAALIVPNPIEESVFYVFTPDDARALENGTSRNGFHYTTVDMELDGGLGDVSDKNFELLPECSEKVSAVWNSRENYYWVVTQYQDRFYTYKIDENGVDPNPVVSVTGPLVDGITNLRGTMKFSPDGTRLAIAHTILSPQYTPSLYLFDFDIETGRVGNPQSVSESRVYYGVEFSSDSSKLYASGVALEDVDGTSRLGDMQIVQFDLENQSFDEGEQLLHSFPNPSGIFVAGTLQIGMDKKIYHAIPGNSLSVIEKPNILGLAANIRPFAVDLGGRFATYGLPPFIQSFFETAVNMANFCEGDATTFTMESTGDIASISWDFGDPDSGGANFSTELNPSHVYSTEGTYTVNISVQYTNDVTRRFIEQVEILNRPIVAPRVTLVQCDADGIEDGLGVFDLAHAIPMFNSDVEEISVAFFLTETDAMANQNAMGSLIYENTAPEQTIYARVSANNECYALVAVDLIVEPMTDLGIYDTISICDAVSSDTATVIDLGGIYGQLALDFGRYDTFEFYENRNDALLEQEPLPRSDYTFQQEGPFEVYFRVEDAEACTFIGRVVLELPEEPNFEPLETVTLCYGKAVLMAAPGFDDYEWPDGSSTPSFLVSATGSVDVVLYKNNCTYLQTFEVRAAPEVSIESVTVNDFQRNNLVEVLARDEGGSDTISYSLDGGENYQESNIFSSVEPGLYTLMVNNGCSLAQELVLVGGVPNFFTPNADDRNDYWTMNNAEFFPDYNISIYTRFGKLLAVLEKGEYWDGNYGNQEMPTDDYWYRIDFEDGRTVQGYFSLINR